MKRIPKDLKMEVDGVVLKNSAKGCVCSARWQRFFDAN